MADYRQYFQAVLRPRSQQAVEEFFTLSGRYSNFRKETCFLRYLAGLRRYAGAAAPVGGGPKGQRERVPVCSRPGPAARPGQAGDLCDAVQRRELDAALPL